MKTAMIGVTGGIGSGKSVAAQYLAKLGAAVVDADRIGHHVLASHEVVKEKLVQAFGKKVLDDSGIPDRKALGALVFSDSKAMRTLNEIIHPLLLEEMWRDVESQVQQKVKAVVVDAALIVEWGIAKRFDVLIVLVTSEAVRLERLKDRGFNLHDAKNRIASQIADQERVAVADVVINTDGDGSELFSELDLVWEKCVNANANTG